MSKLLLQSELQTLNGLDLSADPAPFSVRPCLEHELNQLIEIGPCGVNQVEA